METKKQTKTTEMEEPHRDSVRGTKEKVLGDIPKVKFRYKVGDTVYFTAYPKKNPDCFFVCEGVVEVTTNKNGRPTYRIKIYSVGDKPLIGKSKADSKHLLGKIVTKRENELTKTLSSLMEPKEWIK